MTAQDIKNQLSDDVKNFYKKISIMKLENGFITEETIQKHFLVNPRWAKLFQSKYKKWTVKNYLNKAYKLFIDNGYEFRIIERYSKNPGSTLYCALKESGLFKEDEEIAVYYNLNESQYIPRIINWLITEDEKDSTININFENFK